LAQTLQWSLNKAAALPSSYVMVKKNTFIHINASALDSSSRFRSKSAPCRPTTMEESDDNSPCLTSFVAGRKCTRPTARPTQAYSLPCSPAQPNPATPDYAPARYTFYRVDHSPSHTDATTVPDEQDQGLVALDFVMDKYISAMNNDGATVMWHGLPSKCHVEPDLLAALDRLGATDVEYIYLPLNHWEKSKTTSSKCRNKGYAFLHFSNAASAEDFRTRVAEPINFAVANTLMKSTSTTTANYQGITANLFQMLNAGPKRTVDGNIYVKMGGAMTSVNLSSLRKLMPNSDGC
jgi:hypothetical protein